MSLHQRVQIEESNLGHLFRAQGAGLHTAAVAIGKTYFGTATDNPELTNSAYVQQLNNTDDFGQLTPGNSQKVRQHVSRFYIS